MKLTELFWRDRTPDHRNGITAPPRPDGEMADRSSMADLVRLLKEADDTQGRDGPQPA